ncbi:semaphorin-6B-like [Clavelina lepadiformis]|uniref:semaphorin-6B-like n=1 Tax=Clavelina lepadiformis TaxID=159417 RepID=UPI004042C7D8
MRVSTALIVVNIILCLIQSSMGRIPTDKEPINVYKLEDSTWLQVFRGSKKTGQSTKTLPLLKNFQGMTNIGGYHYIYARDNIFVLDLKNQSSGTGEVTYKQAMTWKSDEASIQLCQRKGQTNKKCQNFIKIFKLVHDGESPNRRVIVCSTKSFSPTCRYYELTEGGNLSYLNQEFGGKLSCPYDPDYDVASLVSGDNLYTATQAGFRGDDPLIFRSSVVRNVHSRRDASLRTASGEATFLNGPHFIKFFDGGMSLNKVYSFFTEISVEDKSEQVYTRIGQVCKNDGGWRNLRNQFSSFLKARLNCSLPGKPPFYFNELSDVTELVSLDKWYKVGKTKMVFALMNTPSNSIHASAICAFSLPDIEASMNGAFYEKFADAKTSAQYWAQQDHPPNPHVASCASDPSKLSVCSLNFMHMHPIMYQSVNAWDLHGNVTQPHNAIPLYSRTNSGNFLTAFVVDTTAGTTPIYTVFIAGTDDGRILKVLLGAGTKSVLIEERLVYSEDRCGPGNKRALSINLDKPTGSMLVAFENCVIRAPLCALNTSCGRSCIKSRDPYCGWDGKNCVVVDSQYHVNSTSGAQPRQDVLEGNVAGMEECNVHATDLGAPSIGATLPSFENEEVEPAVNDTSYNITVAPVMLHDVSGATTSEFTIGIVFLLVSFVVGVVFCVCLCALHRGYCCGKLSKKDDVILTTLPNGNDVRRSSNQSNGENASKSRQRSSHARNRTSTHKESRRTRRIKETSALSGAEMGTFHSNDLFLSSKHPLYYDVTDRRSKQLRSSSCMGGRCKAHIWKPSTSSSPENTDDLQHFPQVDYYVVIDNQRAKTVVDSLLGAQSLFQQHSLQVADTMPGRYDQQQHPLYVSMPPPVQNPSTPIPAGWPNPPQPNPTPSKAFEGQRVLMDTHDRRKMINWQPQYQVPQNEVFEESAQQKMMGLPNGHAGRKWWMSESEKNSLPVMSRPTRYHPFLHTIHEEQEPASHGTYEGPKDDSKQTILK